MTKLSIAFALVLGVMGCVTEDEEVLPQDPQSEQDNLPTNGGDPPGDNVPGPGDETCGGNQLKGDGACTPGD